MQASLEALLCTLSQEEFFTYYKNGEPFALRNLEGPLSELVELPFLNSFDNLIKFWPDSVNAYLPGINDEVNSQQVKKETARELFKEGKGLFFDDPNRFNEVIDKWLKAIHRDLGLSELTYSRSLIYAIAKDQGTSTHFDQNINFVLQISGTKKWWLAKNEMVTNPMSRYTIGADMEPELESYLEGDIPKGMPRNATEIELKPGSLLFLPRGVWHKTIATSDAISLNFTFTAPTWIDLLTSFLRAKLAQSPSWRGTADFVNDPSRSLESIDQFDLLLSELKENINQLSAQDILGATEYIPR